LLCHRTIFPVRSKAWPPFLITNIVAMTVRLFLTSFVMKRRGVGVALLVLPCTVLLGSSSFLLLPATRDVDSAN
jgi:ATP/ADP translocase